MSAGATPEHRSANLQPPSEQDAVEAKLVQDESRYDDAQYEDDDAPYDDTPYEDDDRYRTLSKGAVMSLLLALASAPLVWLFLGEESIFYVVLALPLIGAGLGFVSLLRIRRNPWELVGKIPALIGIAVCSLCIVVGIGVQTYILATEVPEGYEPITWYDLKTHDANEPLPIPQQMLELNGKKVFIKAYVHPSVSTMGPVKQCMLVGDMKTCCFGGNPKLIERIDAVFENNLTINYSMNRRKLGGTLILNVDYRNPRTFFKPDDGTQGPYYILQVDYVK
jgi:hypothetical protein